MATTESATGKIILKDYKNFSFSPKPQEWSPQISFFSLNHDKSAPEFIPLKLEGKMNVIHNKISRFYSFLRDNFGLDGIDNKGLLVPIFLGRPDRAASFCSTCPKPIPENIQAIYIHNNFLKKSVLSHEITHGIVKTFSILGKIKKNLVPWKSYCQAVALDESIADIFAISFKHWLKREDPRALKWKVFTLTDVLSPELNEAEKNEKSRDFSRPKTFANFKELSPRQREELNRQKAVLRTKLQDPETDGLMTEVIHEELDDIKEMKNVRFEHDNSLIPSHAFYAVCAQYLNCPSYQLAKIWIDAAKNIELKNSDFRGFAKQTVIEASRFIWRDEKGQLHNVEEAVRKGWNKVGISC